MEHIDMKKTYWVNTKFTAEEINSKSVTFSLLVDSNSLIKGKGIMEFVLADNGDIAIEVEARLRDQPEEDNKFVVFSLTQQWADKLAKSPTGDSDFECIVE